MRMPQPVRDLMGMLVDAGYQAYAVGGCVRDSLLERTPSDWDIATSATPDQMKACFAGLRTIDTGLRHGTVTVLAQGMPYEITTFRSDGEYTDHRRPDGVRFVADLRQDLSRRDFTVNAMALGLDGGLVDLFDGQGDLKNRLIRCVGDPMRRFSEDALRILRALRFASAYEFEIEQRTARAMREKKELLSFVSGERVFEELKRTLCGAGAMNVLEEFPDVLAAVIPEIAPAVGFLQHNPHHDSDVWGHTARAVSAVEPAPVLRLTMLLHDLGKPRCFTMDDGGIGHFYGHAKLSEQIAERALSRMKSDTATKQRVIQLIRIHDMRPEPSEVWIRRRLNKMGAHALADLLCVQRADALAQSALKRKEKLQTLDECQRLLHAQLAQDACFSLAQLAVRGQDLLAIGVPEGRRVGEALNALLALVIDGKIDNDKQALLAKARRFL